MADSNPTADELDSYDLDHLKQLAKEAGINIGRKLEKGLRIELKAHYAAQEAGPSARKTPKRPVRQATLNNPTQQTPPVAKTPRKTAATATKKRKAGELDESEDQPARRPLDRSSLVGRRLHFTLQHIQTTRSELINEELGEILEPTIEGLYGVVEALEKIIPRE